MPINGVKINKSQSMIPKKNTILEKNNKPNKLIPNKLNIPMNPTFVKKLPNETGKKLFELHVGVNPNQISNSDENNNVISVPTL